MSISVSSSASVGITVQESAQSEQGAYRLRRGDKAHRRIDHYFRQSIITPGQTVLRESENAQRSLRACPRRLPHLRVAPPYIFYRPVPSGRTSTAVSAPLGRQWPITWAHLTATQRARMCRLAHRVPYPTFAIVQLLLHAERAYSCLDATSIRTIIYYAGTCCHFLISRRCRPRSR